MKNKKIINRDNLIYNLKKCQSKFSNLCVMVKANAYGHGMINVVNELKNQVNLFGVANTAEALQLRRRFKDINIFVAGKTKEFKNLIKNNISITIDEIGELEHICKICKNSNKKAKIHIAVNTGMNRIGTKNIYEFKKLLTQINKNDNIILEGIFTHAFDADLKNNHFYEQMQKFYEFVKLIKDKSVLIHIGGSYVLKQKIPNFVNMVRIGYFIYGYGMRGLKPVMQIQSHVIKIIDCKKGEYVGYGNKSKLKQNTKIAVVSLGYADGLHRRLSNVYTVTINSQKCPIVGNICMDMFMVDVTNINCKVGYKVLVMDNACDLAQAIQTSPYEMLTSFNQIR